MVGNLLSPAKSCQTLSSSGSSPTATPSIMAWKLRATTVTKSRRPAGLKKSQSEEEEEADSESPSFLASPWPWWP